MSATVESMHISAVGIFLKFQHISLWLCLGDIVECMARSDNVPNTGFCPRADRDSVDLFTAALTLSPRNTEEARQKPKSSDKGLNGHIDVLAPPMSEFDMLVTKLRAGETEKIKAL
jgi:mannose-6-phosphate isomerase